MQRETAEPIARAYIELLRQHLQKEDHCLFSMADQALSPADQSRLLAAFERVERGHMGAGTHERFLKLANDLADRYGVAHAVQADPVRACCCQH
jgi:hemerythrin-like domain-containing protein